MRGLKWFGLVLALLLSGCGGSHSDSGGPAIETTPLKFTINWQGRSRDLSPPSSALSAVFTLPGGNPDGSDLKVVVDRHADPAAYTESYTSEELAKVGLYDLSVEFHSDTGGKGIVVAEATASVSLSEGGGDIGPVTVGSQKVISVSIPDGQIVPLGGSTRLRYTARDASGALVAVSPGSAVWMRLGIDDFTQVEPDGTAFGKAPGTSAVQVTLDFIASLPQAVTVPAMPDFVNPGFEEPALTANTWKPAEATSDNPWPRLPIANGTTEWGTGPHSGSQYGFLAITQALRANVQPMVTGFTTGARYRVSLWAARRPGGVGADVKVGLSLDAGGPRLLDRVPVPDDGSWIHLVSESFMPVQTIVPFQISAEVIDLGQPAIESALLLDDVHIEAVP